MDGSGFWIERSPVRTPRLTAGTAMCLYQSTALYSLLIVGRICNNFEKNRASYDKSMKLGT